MKVLLGRTIPRPWALTALVLVCLVSAIVLWPSKADAQSSVNIFNDPANFISQILIVIVGFLGKLLVQIINILISVAKYNSFSDAVAIQRGWVILRDLGNIFFIIVLMVIAFATILKIESYRYNRLLGRLILMAVLVNFSRLIAGLFIDFTQVIMLTFVSAFQNAAAGNLAQALGLTELLKLSTQGTGQVTSGEIMTALILANAMLLIALVVVGIVALVLVMRILALWLLVVLSPIAYIARTFPLTERFSRLWWSNFGKYATSGPIMAFFLWLTFTIVSTGTGGNINTNTYGFENPDTAEVNSSTSQGLPDSISSTISEASSSDNILTFIIAISLLVGSLTVTSQLGVAGGRFAGEASERVRRLAGRGAVLLGAGAAAGLPGVGAALFGRQAVRGVTGAAVGTAKFIPGYAERKIYSGTGVGLSPRRIREGFREAFADRQRKDELSGAGQAGERLRKGGLGGFLTGAVGAPRDWAEVYTRGFLARKGVQRAYQTITGGEKAVAEIEKQIKVEQEKLKELKGKANVFSNAENAEMKQRLAARRSEVNGLNAFTSGTTNTIDNSKLSEENRFKVASLVNGQIKVLRSEIEKASKDLKTEKDDKKRNELKDIITKKKSTADVMTTNYRPLVDLFQKREAAANALAEAKLKGDKAEEAKQESALSSLKGDIIKSLPAQINLGPNWDFGDDWRKQLQSVQNKMQKEVDTLEVNVKLPTVSEEEKKARIQAVKDSNSQIEKLEKQQIAAAGPEAFYALRDRRGLIREEMRKIETSNEDELIYMFNNAMQIGDKINAAAIMMQAAHAGHLNEIVNSQKYQHNRTVTPHEAEEGWEEKNTGEYFDSNQQGISDFFNQVMGEQLGMNKDEYLSLQSDVSDIAQENNHWDLAQSIGVHKGEMFQHSPHEQAMRVIIETSKQDQESLARRGNRLMYGGERIDPSTGERYHRLEAYGLSLIKGSWPTILAEISERGRYNQNAAKNLTNEGNMKVLRALAETLDNDPNNRKKYKGLDGEVTQREGFNQFLDVMKQYAERKAPNYGKETRVNEEVVKEGRMME